MKYCKFLFIFFLSFIVFSAYAQQPIIPNTEISNQDSIASLERFKSIVAEVSEQMGFAMPVVVVLPHPFPADSTVQVWLEKRPAVSTENPQLNIIYVYYKFLLKRPDVVFKQSVIYEYCRIQLKHTGPRNESTDLEKLRAGSCVYQWLGEDYFIEYILYIAEEFPEYSLFAEISRDELVKIVRKYFKKSPQIKGVIDNLPTIEKVRIIISSLMQSQEYKADIKYNIPPPQIDFDEDVGYWIVARYIVKEKKIVIDPYYKNFDLTPLLYNINNPIFTNGDSTGAIILRNVLAHELGHYFTDIYIERYGQNSWLAPYFENYIDLNRNNLGLFMVIEGIAEYFKKIFIPSKKVWFTSEQWNKERSAEDFDYLIFVNRIIYRGGYDLVEPIFKKRGVKEGMAWLLQNELRIDIPDISVVSKYQDRALKEK